MFDDKNDLFTTFVMIAAIVVAVVIGVYCLYNHATYGEINNDGYQEVQRWLKECPEIAPDVDQSLNKKIVDGKVRISPVEWAHIKELHDTALIDRQKKDLQRMVIQAEKAAER